MSRDIFFLLAFGCGDAKDFSFEEIKSIIEYSSNFPEEQSYIGYPDTILNGQQKYSYLVSGSSWDFLYEPIDTFGCNNIEDIAIFGLPFRSGTGIVAPQMYMSIPANAKCPDGAWAFLKSMLMPKYDCEYLNLYPLLKADYNAAREHDIQNAKEKGIKTNIWRDGQSVEVIYNNVDFYNLSDRLLAGVNGIYTNDQAIYNIVSDSAAPYFNGDKSLDDAANEIMSRLEIYFAEKS